MPIGYIKQPAIAFDQLCNALIWIKGDGQGFADETLSARLYRCWLQDLISDKWYRLVDALLFFDPQHCYTSWRSEVDRRQLPSHYQSVES